MVHDLVASRRFYGGLFGWEFDEGPSPLGAYVRALREGHPVAGLGEMAGEMAGGLRRVTAWLPYIATNDADATAALIRECGGTVAVGPLDVDQVGRLGIAADIGGAAFGIWEGGPRRSGRYHGVEGAVSWNELFAVETSGVGKFYERVFGYDVGPEPAQPPGSDFLTLRLGSRPVAGIRGAAGALPRDRGPHWLTYFSVVDLDDTLERVVALGGRRLTEPESSPFGVWARASDPEGAPFAVIVPTKPSGD
ncbi:VOC family protein [Streptomyces hainanensis]|nr:VOC family protein [Streptomyces hainanensis]